MSLRALARFCYRRRKLIVVFWVLALFGMNMLAGGIGNNFTTNFNAPNTESNRAMNLIQASFRGVAGDGVQVVMEGSPSMNDPAVKTQVASLLAALERVPHVTTVSNPYTTPGTISKSGTIALATGQLDRRPQDISNAVGRQLIAVLHVECDANATVAEAHVIAEAVEHEVAHKVPAVRLDVHMDPSTGSLTRAT